MRRYFVDASTLQFDEWLRIILSNEFDQLINGKSFPSDQVMDQFISVIHSLTEEQIKTVLRRFLVRTGESERDANKLNGYQATNGEFYGDLVGTEYLRRLTSSDNYAWEGITWILDLLPYYPLRAIDAISSYISAHIMILHDLEINGLSDAVSVIKARYIDKEHPKEYFLRLHPRQFEYLVGVLFEKMGYETTVTPYSNDGGKDVIAISQELGRKEKIYIECKNSTSKVGPEVIWALIGVVTADRATKGIVVCASDFTRKSKEEAGRNGIELINNTDLSKLLNSYYGTNWPVSIDKAIFYKEKEDKQGL
ncbi:restriction endonuclease [Paenibacillus sp. FSL H8-0537]|uniref:restriction endonuclease n=1 Tax=Paenibacillus sp. FSL H8-0537 TaxID=2921399 RepID=UPI003100AB8B